MTHMPPTPIGVTKSAIHSLAESIADQLKFAPGDSMEPVVARLGGRITYKHAPRNSLRLPESIVVRAKSDFTIYLATSTSIERDRFTLAHELGHYFLHFPEFERKNPGHVMAATRWVDENDASQQRAEWEANWFAAAFLMPAAPFRESWNSSQDASKVSRKFRVSAQAAEVRARVLGLM